MADEDKAQTKEKAAKPGTKTAANAKTSPKNAKAAAAARGAADADAPKCHAEKCKLAVRAKGYCRKHFIAWRREDLGKKHRYKICTKEGCRKPRALGSLCDEHSGKAQPAAEGGAA
jgi:hypothetical protein